MRDAGRTLLAVGACALAVAGCESSQAKSARLAKGAKAAAKTTSVRAGAANRSVEVVRTRVLRGPDGVDAAVVELRNTGASAQAAVPIQIQVRDAKGATVYRNDLQGLQVALQELAYLPPHATTTWVHDQVTTTEKATSVKVEVGRESGPPAAGRGVPDLVLSGVRLDTDASGVFATGKISNASRVPQPNLPVYAVARRGSRIVAAGRAVIERLDPTPPAKPSLFRIFFVGDPRGARLEVRPAPTALEAR